MNRGADSMNTLGGMAAAFAAAAAAAFFSAASLASFAVMRPAPLTGVFFPGEDGVAAAVGGEVGGRVFAAAAGEDPAAEVGEAGVVVAAAAAAAAVAVAAKEAGCG